MKIFILTFFFQIKESKITRGHNFTLVKRQSRLDVRKFSFSQRTINVWTKIIIMVNHVSKIQSGHSVILSSSFGQTRPSILRPNNSHLSDGPLIILSLQLLLMSIKLCSYNLQSLFVV